MSYDFTLGVLYREYGDGELERLEENRLWRFWDLLDRAINNGSQGQANALPERVATYVIVSIMWAFESQL